MKKVLVSITLLEKGDRVHTPEGRGTVMETEKVPKTEYDVMNRDVKVLLDEPTSRHTNCRYLADINGCIYDGKYDE